MSGSLVRVERTPVPTIGISRIARRATRLTFGAAGLITSATVDILDRLAPTDTAPARGAGVLDQVPGALLGAGFEAQRRFISAVGLFDRGAARVLATVTRPAIVRSQLEATGRSLARWSARGRVEQEVNRRLVGDTVRRLAPEVAAAAMVELDVPRLLDVMPLDEIVARVDVDAIVRRVDVDAIMRRVDLDALLARVDVAALADRILDQIDLAGLIRQSTTSVGGDAVFATRASSMKLDDLVARLVDRALLRGAGRDLAVPDPSS